MNRRILFAIHGPADPRTAVFFTVSKRAEFLRALGDEVDVVSPADFNAGKWPRVHPILLPLELAARKLGRYDAVIFHSYLAWAHAAKFFAVGRRPASIVAFHGLEPLYHAAVAAELARTNERLSGRFQLLHTTVLPKLLRLACRRADGVFCLNALEREFIVSNDWAEPGRVSVLPNGVGGHLLTAERTYEPVARRLLFTGQWLRAKGTRYLADAFASLARSDSDVELTCLGTAASADTVLRDFDPSLHGRIRVLPRVGPAELAAELGRADLFVFPSLSEGFSGALLEALASGLPVIATPAGAAPELLAHGVSGMVVPFADAAAIAAAAKSLLGDRARREAFGAAARCTAASYEWNAVNRSFADAVDRVVRRVA
jgi:glycosyltransferase involved in cell wall biosynthesis